MIYVVQQEQVVEREPLDDGTIKNYTAWIDIATVDVEPRAKRSTVLKKALAEAGIEPSGEKPRLRALDAESAEVHEPEPYQPPTEWRL